MARPAFSAGSGSAHLLLLLLLPHLAGLARAQTLCAPGFAQLAALQCLPCPQNTFSLGGAATACAACTPGSAFLGATLGCAPPAALPAAAGASLFLALSSAEGAAAALGTAGAAPAAPTFVADRFGTAGGALQFALGSSLVSAPALAQLPTGMAARAVAVAVRCDPPSSLAGRTILDFSDGQPSSVWEHFSIVGSAVGSGLVNLTIPAYSAVTVAGSTSVVAPALGFADGTGTNAIFNHMNHGAVDPQGNVYVADTGNYRIRKITPAGVVTTAAGYGCCASTNDPSTNVTATAAIFGSPQATAFDPTFQFLYIADPYQQKLRMLNLTSGNITTVAGWFNSAYVNGFGTNARFQNLNAMAVDMNASSPFFGCIYVTEGVGHRVRRVCDPLGVASVTTIAGGNGSSTTGFKDGLGTNAMFASPRGIGIDA